MLRLLGTLYMVVGLLGCILLLFAAANTGDLLMTVLAALGFFSAFLIPAILYALDDIVKATQETAKTMQSIARAQSEAGWVPPPMIE